MKDTVVLGFQVSSGAEVQIPIGHLAVTGQTQLSGKTTTLEALIARSGRRALAFRTKRAEGAFTAARAIPPYFRERADWQFVAAILEATLRERLKFQRPWIMKVCRGTQTLADVQAAVQRELRTAKGLSESVYTELDAYFDIVVPQIQRLPLSSGIVLEPGINVMDLTEYSTEVQALVIRSALEWIYERERQTIAIIPEAWEFLPQTRSSPVLLAAEQLVRKGAAAQNFLWLDSQDLAGVHKAVLRSVGVWILGVQREANEIKRTLAHVHAGDKPRVADIAHLERGQFFACFGRTVTKVYVQPAWLSAETAVGVARGEFTTDAVSGMHGVITSIVEHGTLDLDDVGHAVPRDFGQRVLDGASPDRTPARGRSTEQPPAVSLDAARLAGAREALAQPGMTITPRTIEIPAHPAPEEVPVNAAEAEALRTTNEQLRTENEQLRAQIIDVENRLAALDSARLIEDRQRELDERDASGAARVPAAPAAPADRPGAAPAAAKGAPPADRPAAAAGAAPRRYSAGESFDNEALYQAFKRRLIAELPSEPDGAAFLRVLVARPELQVSVKRHVITVDGDTLRGRVARLIAEGFFAKARTSADIGAELGRRGSTPSNIELGNQLKALVEMGFFTRDNKWISLVPEMKVNVVEAA